MKLRVILIALLGLGLALYLIRLVGFEAVFSTVRTVGWGGFAILCVYALALYVLLGAAWYVLISGVGQAPLATFIWGRIVRDSAAELLPFSQVGGFIIGARAAIVRGVPTPVALASTIVDVTTELIAQLAYIGLGIALLAARSARTPFTDSLIGILILGLAVAAAAGGGFFLAQRRGLWVSAKFTSRWLPQGFSHATAIAAALDTIYLERVRVALSLILHLAGWIASAIGTWLAFYLVGVNVDLGAVVMIESLICAIRSAAFFVPNAMGVQEGAYAVVAPLMGVGAEFGLAISLLKRARDIAIGIPILLIWQTLEGRRALADDMAKTI